MSEYQSDTEADSIEEEDEPILKFSRMADLNDLKVMLENDSISCVAVHSRFICIGTHWGNVYLMDHQGNKINMSMNAQLVFPSHMVSVNTISVDPKGEFVGTCSDDGMAHMIGLCQDEYNHHQNIGQPVKSICVGPPNAKSGRRFIVGDTKLTLYEKYFMQGLKPVVLNEAEGFVSAIAWSDHLVAWASSLGVRVYDLNERCSLGLIKWEDPLPEDGHLTNFRCNLRWSSPNTLLIGWVDTIRVCVIRKTNVIEVAQRGLPGFIVDPISTFQTDFFICGLAPLDAEQIVVLGQLKERDPDTGKAQRPVVCVMQHTPSNYISICTSSITMRGFEEYKCSDYHLDCLRDEQMYFIVAPKDLVVASLCENDDRIQWLINHSKFEEAMVAISTHGGRYSQVSVARLYLDHLLQLKQFDAAATVCLRWFGRVKDLWEEEVYKFVNHNQLRAVKAYLPRSIDCKLSPHIYEMVLYEYLTFDTTGFLELIVEWPPELYDTAVIINAIKQHLKEHLNADGSNILLEALAILYTHENKFEEALMTYLRLQHSEVFNLIRKHNLYANITDKIITLMDLDRDKATAMLLETDKVPSTTVVRQLEHNDKYLLHYLDSLDKVDRSGKHHSTLIRLYAKYDRDKLLPFLRRAQNYNIKEVLDMCREYKFYAEMVYLLDRTGNTIEALSIIIDNMCDIDKAIDFCKDNNDLDLWDMLIKHSLNHADVLTNVLDGVVGFINPEVLITQIRDGDVIPNLKRSLIKMLCDTSLQMSIQSDCNSILVADYFGLHERLLQSEQRAMFVSHEHTCGMCRKDIIVKENPKIEIVLFNCRHMFHGHCLPDAVRRTEICHICSKK